MEKNRNCVPSIHFDIRGYSEASVIAMYLRLLDIKGRFLEFRRYHNFANLFSKLSKSTVY